MTTLTTLERLWRDEVLKLADRYYKIGHRLEDRARELGGDLNAEAKTIELIAKADVYHEAYRDLHELINQVDPRSGAAWAAPSW